MMDHILDSASDRINAIISGDPGVIVINQGIMRTDETVRIYPIQSLVLSGKAAGYIVEYADTIEAAAVGNGITADLLKAVIWQETTDSLHDVLRSSLINDTLVPTNADAAIWGKLTNATPGDLADPRKNIELAAAILGEIAGHLKDPTPAGIATLYNSTSQNKLNAYGVEVANYLKDKPWENIIEQQERAITIFRIPGTSSYLGDRHITNEVVREYVDSYINGDLLKSSKVLVNGYNGAAIVADVNFYPDAIIRKAAGYESAADQASDKAAADRAVAEYNRDRQGVASQFSASGSGSASGTTTYPTNGGGTTPTYVSGTGYVGDHPGPSKAVTKPSVPAYGGGRPILLDLNGNGVQITDLSKSTQFIDAGNDGFKHRTAWAAAGDGVLFYDADNDNTISQTHEYVFTEWDPTAKSDMQALRARFDNNNDGKLTADDAAFAQFKVMVTQADGSQVAQSLTQLGITEIRLTEDATQTGLSDGSMINGRSTFVMNGVTGTVASAVLMAEMQGYRVVETVSLSGTDREQGQTDNNQTFDLQESTVHRSPPNAARAHSSCSLTARIQNSSWV